MKTSIQLLIITALLTLTLAGSASGQSSPSSLLDLSLFELSNVRVTVDEVLSESNTNKSIKKGSIGYRYIRGRFSGYRDGTKNLSKREVLFVPGTDARTDRNFPVVPTVIIQEAHIIEGSYRVSPSLTINAVVPYIIQETDHISIVPGFGDFLIRSEGLGDITVNTSLNIWQNGPHHLSISAGLSLPTGSIDEKGATPRDPVNDTQLPYTMQIGSGTFDFLPSISYFGSSDSFLWGADLRGTLRTGRNSRDYRLGNKLLLKNWVEYNLTDWMTPGLELHYTNWGHIIGQDDEIIFINTPFPYPAAVTNPKYFGGEKINLGASLKITGTTEYFKDVVLKLSGSIPVHQNLNGPQPKESWRFSFRCSLGY